MIRRKRGALGSVFLPAWQGWRTQFARAGNNRSRLAGLLSRRNTASHRSSVVIIRCNIEITKLRALPLLFAASFSPRGIFTSFFVHSPTFIFDKIKNGAFHSKCEAPFNKSFSGDFLRRHYPHQVKKGRS